MVLPIFVGKQLCSFMEGNQLLSKLVLERKDQLYDQLPTIWWNLFIRIGQKHFKMIIQYVLNQLWLYGVKRSKPVWFREYSIHRSQSIEVWNIRSFQSDIFIGVRQGSISHVSNYNTSSFNEMKIFVVNSDTVLTCCSPALSWGFWKKFLKGLNEDTDQNTRG